MDQAGPGGRFGGRGPGPGWGPRASFPSDHGPPGFTLPFPLAHLSSRETRSLSGRKDCTLTCMRMHKIEEQCLLQVSMGCCQFVSLRLRCDKSSSSAGIQSWALKWLAAGLDSPHQSPRARPPALSRPKAGSGQPSQVWRFGEFVEGRALTKLSCHGGQPSPIWFQTGSFEGRLTPVCCVRYDYMIL